MKKISVRIANPITGRKVGKKMARRRRRSMRKRNAKGRFVRAHNPRRKRASHRRRRRNPFGGKSGGRRGVTIHFPKKRKRSRKSSAKKGFYLVKRGSVLGTPRRHGKKRRMFRRHMTVYSPYKRRASGRLYVHRRAGRRRGVLNPIGGTFVKQIMNKQIWVDVAIAGVTFVAMEPAYNFVSGYLNFIPQFPLRKQVIKVAIASGAALLVGKFLSKRAGYAVLIGGLMSPTVDLIQQYGGGIFGKLSGLGLYRRTSLRGVAPASLYNRPGTLGYSGPVSRRVGNEVATLTGGMQNSEFLGTY